MLELATRDAVRDLFVRAGFTKVGFTTAEPVADRVSDWVAEGRHAGMAYMAEAPARRADPRALLPEAASVVCVAAAYPATDGTGAIAGYARGEDYHRTLKAALHDAVARLGTLLPDVRARVCVDTAPLLERALAARAGLGWIGKNTMLLDERHGPWLLLGAVLLDAALPPDGAVEDRCGTCTACLDACPTDAFVAERVLDARRCLSYWTIEHRGEVPEPYASAVGERVFGCDDCLAACPFPRGRATAATPAWQPREDLVAPSLDDLEARANASFRRHFASTPIERARKRGLLRNIALARAARMRGPPRDPRDGPETTS